MGRRRRAQGGVGRSRSRILFWSGATLLLGGLVALGYVGWQLWGTTWVAHREQRELTGTLQRQWQEGGQRLQPRHVPSGEASALVRIPAFGEKYVVPVLEGTSDDVLATGYGHFTSSADPGEVGNYALAAHRVTHGEPLRRMPELRPGDEVIVETVDTTYTYRLDTDPRKLVIPFTGTWVLDPLPRNPDGGTQPGQRPGQRLITLTTCAELFHTDERMIAFGHLVSADPKDR